MYFGVDYHPEQWVYPYAGSADKPEAAWAHDVELMQMAGVNVVRIGEFTWGICEREEGKYDFSWLRRVMDVMTRTPAVTDLDTPVEELARRLSEEKLGALLVVDQERRLLGIVSYVDVLRTILTTP